MLARVGPLFRRQMEGERARLTLQSGHAEREERIATGKRLVEEARRMRELAPADGVPEDVVPPRLTFHDLMMDACRAYGFTSREIKSLRRDVDILPARFEVYWRAMVELGMSSPRVAALMGGRDHTTALHGRQKVNVIFQRAFGVGGADALAVPMDERREALRRGFADAFAHAQSQRGRAPGTLAALAHGAALRSDQRRERDQLILAAFQEIGVVRPVARVVGCAPRTVRLALQRHGLWPVAEGAK